MNLELYLRRRHKVVLAPGVLAPGEERLPDRYLAAVLKNIENLGYTFSPALVERAQTLSLDALAALYDELVPALRTLVGAHRVWKPMYPNFPQQVMEMSEARLYLNAVVHYLTNRLPIHPKEERLPLLDKTNLKVIDLGSVEDYEAIFTGLVSAKGSLSATDKADVAWFIENLRDDVTRLLPDEVPSRETVAVVGALLLSHTSRGQAFVDKHVKTATDVLRLAVALSDGDVSLATPTKFVSFPRARRRLLLQLLENSPNTIEDLRRWPGRWLRLGERLHPGEMKGRFPRVHSAFEVLRGDAKSNTFGTRIERALQERNTQSALQLLKTRPGELARRLDHVARLSTRGEEVAQTFDENASRVSTPVLLQMLAHFKHRNEPQELRTFFPKGDVGKVQAIPYDLAPLDENLRQTLVATIEGTLRARFAELPPLGACFLDEKMRDFPLPFANRSASKALQTLPRGSRLELPEGKVLRFFIWWKNGRERTDIDLSAALFDGDFKYLDIISYYNLKNYGGCHSGDIVDAPKGAAEFIDLDIARVLASGARYIVMSVNSYTTQPFCDLPECFAGWMARTHAQSGEIFEPKTVANRVDLASDTQISLPLVIDLQERKVLWLDIALRRHPSWNNVANNLSGVGLMLRAMTGLQKLSMYELFELHIAARGERVETRENAATIFSPDEGVTPFQIDLLASQWM